ncbi:MAG: hypothetical protein QF415_17605 [Candidatus Undinarchaeales archaeon]|nr:hypothetical protein [Candidatus Undinarchaeales archaeon]
MELTESAQRSDPIRLRRIVVVGILTLVALHYLSLSTPCGSSRSVRNIMSGLMLWYVLIGGLAELVRHRYEDYLAFLSIAGLVIPLALLIGLTQILVCPSLTMSFTMLAAAVYILRAEEWNDAFETLDFSPYEDISKPTGERPEDINDEA